MRTCKPTEGFTLIEIQITLLILVGVLVFAIPAWSNILLANRLATESNTFLAALHLTRSEAVKRNVRTALCVSTNGVGCSGNADWHQGWIMFADANNNALRDSNEIIIRQGQPLSSNLLLTGNTPVAKYISYTGSGVTRLVSGALQMGTLTLCKQSFARSDARLVIINSTGRPRVTKTTKATCP